MPNPETVEATRQWMSDLQVTDADRIAAVFGENEISLANLHHFSLEELTSLGISKQDATTIRRASTAANETAHAEPNHTLPSNVACHGIAEDTPTAVLATIRAAVQQAPRVLLARQPGGPLAPFPGTACSVARLRSSRPFLV